MANHGLKNIFKSVAQAYSKAPFYNDVIKDYENLVTKEYQNYCRS